MRLRCIVTGSTAIERLDRRWGVSFLINDDVLFDCFGREDYFIEQVRILKVDLSRIRHVVISHDHWDHIAGLAYVLGKTECVNVYVCEPLRNEMVSLIRSYGANLIVVRNGCEITPGVMSTGPIQGVYNGQPLYEQGLIVGDKEPDSLVTACAHPGLEVMLAAAHNYILHGIRQVCGGFHLRSVFDEKIVETVEKLRQIGIQRVFSTHCTGNRATRILCKAFAPASQALKTGDEIRL